MKRDEGPSRSPFEALLARLDSDPRRAGERYEEIRRRLIRLFEWRGALRPDELADETMDRVAKKLHEGVEIEGKDPSGYFYGVARLVYFESRRAEEKKGTVPLTDIASSDSDPADLQEKERRSRCLDRCLEEVGKESRSLILEYYSDSSDSRITTRKRLAERIGVPSSALRLRAHRIRAKLESCMSVCIGEETNPAR
ncbi:MAG: hypothetical protein WBX15_16810 [Thermoanaerobaculia bacterium]